ncbi:maltokinase N-terminal cap-like domain-containing protein [Microbacterium amylolyticum]|nr:phosphotransferase [Microbacterium amylolyticum]
MMPLPTPSALEAYLVRTRWFGGKGRPFHVMGVRPLARSLATEDAIWRGRSDDETAGPDVVVLIVDVAYEDDQGGAESYQVPISTYSVSQPRIDHALVGVFDDVWAYDAVHDRDAMALWLKTFCRGTQEEPFESDGMRFHRLDVSGVQLDADAPSSPLTVEQSNSSVRFGEQTIMKLFRHVQTGVNPDIEIAAELTRAGSENVADLYGWIEGEFDGAVVQLGMLQRFLRASTDGFDLALASVRSVLADPSLHPATYAAEARELAKAIARIHLVLRERFDQTVLGTDATLALANGMRERLDAAILVVPQLDAHAPRLRALFDRVAGLNSLAVQRVHGDLHLGQALRTPDGWRIVDFEGEPSKPLEERRRLDSPWRDVAGLIRSFDYAPAVVQMSSTEPNDDGRSRQSDAWAHTARGVFIQAYAEELGTGGLTEDEAILLDAYIADKAVYETVYETRSRPAWVSIPMTAISRLGRAEETA